MESNSVERPLVPLREGVGERMLQAVQDRETIVVSGLPMFERIELVDALVAAIPKDRRVLVLEARDQRDPQLSEGKLPRNNVVFTHADLPGQTFADMARHLYHMAGDYLVVPNMRAAHLKDFEAAVGHAFDGLIVATDAMSSDPAIASAADVLIEVVSDRMAPRGIGKAWARAPSRA